MKLVAVSQRVDAHPDRGEARDALDRNMVRFLVACDCLSVPVPNVFSRREQGEWAARIRPDGVVLSGGNDPGDFPDRDLTETLLMEYAEERRIPLLGICRGMQMMGLRTGAVLERVDGHVRMQHELRGEIAGTVNSFHNFALAEPPEGYSVLARSGDGSIEAIGHNTLPWEGWMWHPEREAVFCKTDVERARRLFYA